MVSCVLLAGNILLVANWLAEKGIEQKANWLREEFLTGIAIAVIIAFLILLVNTKQISSRELNGFLPAVFYSNFIVYKSLSGLFV